MRALTSHPVLQRLRRVSRARGIGIPTLLTRYVEVRRRNPTAGLTDYLAWKLFDRQFTAGARPEDYLGWRIEPELAQALNPRAVVLPAWDKFTFALFAHAYGLPAPAQIATYRPGGRPAMAVAGVALASLDELADWLRSNATWPVFAKPSFSQQSVGGHHFTGYRQSDDALTTPDGSDLPVAQFLREVEGIPAVQYYRPEMGYLFQQVLQPHPEISRLSGTTQISGLRVVLIQDDDGIEIVSALLKLAGGETHTDRFCADYPKTLIADVAPETGRIRMASSMSGLVTGAPLTGIGLADFRLPDWDRVVTLCAQAASMFPMMRIQHWDVALTDRGPCLLEVNDIGAIGWLQVFGHGLLTPRFRALLRRHGDVKRYPWIERLCR